MANIVNINNTGFDLCMYTADLPLGTTVLSYLNVDMARCPFFGALPKSTRTDLNRNVHQAIELSWTVPDPHNILLSSSCLLAVLH